MVLRSWRIRPVSSSSIDISSPSAILKESGEDDIYNLIPLNLKAIGCLQKNLLWNQKDPIRMISLKNWQHQFLNWRNLLKIRKASLQAETKSNISKPIKRSIATLDTNDEAGADTFRGLAYKNIEKSWRLIAVFG